MFPSYDIGKLNNVQIEKAFIVKILIIKWNYPLNLSDIVLGYFAMKIERFFEFTDVESNALRNIKMFQKIRSTFFPEIITPTKLMLKFAKISFSKWKYLGIV